MYGSRLPLESTDIEIPEIESSRRSTATSLPRGTRMQDDDNTRLVHTTINRR